MLPINQGRQTIIDLYPSTIPAEGVRFVDVAHDRIYLQVAQRTIHTAKPLLGIPVRTFKNLSPSTCTRVIEDLFADSQDAFYVDSLGEIRAVAPPPRVSISDWVDRIFEITRAQHVTNICQTRSGVHFGAVTDSTVEPPSRVGDVIARGLSATINGSVTAAAFTLRLACTNGMRSITAGNHRRVSEDSYAEDLRYILDRSAILAAHVAGLAGQRLTNGASFLRTLHRSGAITSTQLTRILDLLPSLPDDASQFDLINLITAIQHDDHENPMRWVNVAGYFVDALTDTRCTRCGHVL